MILINICNMLSIALIIWIGFDYLVRSVSRIQEWHEKSERGEFPDEPLIFTIFYLLVGIFLICLGFLLVLMVTQYSLEG